jgi:ATP-dependent Clp protease adapter protein ClpS
MAATEQPPAPGNEGDAATATVKTKRRTAPKPKLPGMLPPWKVLLHNDDKNEVGFVVVTIMELTPLKQEEAIQRTFEANDQDVALLLVTHKERAELYRDQFQSKGLTVSIEPTE